MQEVESHFWENYRSGCFNVVDIQYNSEKQREGTLEREWKGQGAQTAMQERKQDETNESCDRGWVTREGTALFVLT